MKLTVKITSKLILIFLIGGCNSKIQRQKKFFEEITHSISDKNVLCDSLTKSCFEQLEPYVASKISIYETNISDKVSIQNDDLDERIIAAHISIQYYNYINGKSWNFNTLDTNKIEHLLVVDSYLEYKFNGIHLDSIPKIGKEYNLFFKASENFKGTLVVNPWMSDSNYYSQDNLIQIMAKLTEIKNLQKSSTSLNHIENLTLKFKCIECPADLYYLGKQQMKKGNEFEFDLRLYGRVPAAR
jgi:hypothetical protein